MDTNKLKLSKYVQVIKRKNDFAVYHSLFGQLVLVNKQALDLLLLFKETRSKDKITGKFQKKKKGKLKKYLVEFEKRFFLVKPGYNEYKIIENDIKKRKANLKTGYLVRGLQLITSNACNFKCKYCFVNDMYNSKERSYLQTSPKNQTMSYGVAKETMEKMLALLKKNKHSVLTVEFFGGEPLVNWPLIKKVLNKFKNGQKYGVKISYTITTNGSLITEEIAKIFKKYGVAVVISFDSPKNKERVRADGKNVLEVIGNKLKILKKTGNWVAFNSTLSKETLADYDGRALVEFAKQNRISMIGLILDLDLKFYESKKNKDQVLKKLWQTYKYARKQKIAITGYWYQIFNQIIGRQAINLRSGYKTCPATGCKISVEPGGDVFICKCCSGHLGHINNLAKLLNSKKYKEYAMKAYRNADECSGCEIENFCSGVCMGSLERKYNNMDVVERGSCQVFKDITKKLIMDLKTNESPNFEL